MAEIKAIRFGFLQNNIEHRALAFEEIKLLTNFSSNFTGENSDAQRT